MSEVFARRREVTESRIGDLTVALRDMHVDSYTACVYATGSVARGEASEHSDLDLFILDTADESLGEVPMTRVQTTLLTADLIRASDEAGFPPFTGDGVYLTPHTVSDLISNTGSQADDYLNSFTARLLLVLESRVVLNEPAHKVAKDRIVASYWRDYSGYEATFRPVFLVNDIMRYWKTLCVNYEASRAAGVPSGVDSVSWRNRNRLRNVKLKFSRLWTCHTTLAHLLWLSADGRAVSPDHAKHMLSLSPVERLYEIQNANIEVDRVQHVIDCYEWFLETLVGAKEDSFAWVDDRDRWIEARARGGTFAGAVSELLQALGQESPLYRFLLV